jgi:hypothetical protein
MPPVNETHQMHDDRGELSPTTSALSWDAKLLNKNPVDLIVGMMRQ